MFITIKDIYGNRLMLNMKYVVELKRYVNPGREYIAQGVLIVAGHITITSQNKTIFYGLDEENLAVMERRLITYKDKHA